VTKTKPTAPTTPTKTVERSELTTMKMVAGNEDLYTRVVDDGRLRGWVGIGWIDEGMATEEHRAIYPTVIESK
jgi:hypothetical protein